MLPTGAHGSTAGKKSEKLSKTNKWLGSGGWDGGWDGEEGTTVVKEERKETSLLEIEVQSHRPHPAREGVPEDAVTHMRGVPCPQSLGEKLSRTLWEKAPPGVGSWFLVSASHPQPPPQSWLRPPCALRGSEAGAGQSFRGRTRQILLPVLLRGTAGQRLS